MSELLEKPEKPGDYECCESGCSPCVWDIYYEKMQQWNEFLAKIKEGQPQGGESDES
ncbi:MAG: oxidoreductase-like domain-containing protein [Neptuniibacter sp.]